MENSSGLESTMDIMSERFVAFIDILGFKEVVKSIEADNSSGNPNLSKIKSILNFMNEETYEPNYSADLPIYVETVQGLIERELGDPRLTYVSDCIVISAEATLDGFKGLSRKIHKITADLAIDGVFCRGAISKGLLYHQGKVMFGSAYNRAYQLEERAAIFPRIIVDPDVLDFFDLTDGKMPLAPAFFGIDEDGYYYQRYWTWFLFPPYAGSWESYLLRVRENLKTKLNQYRGNERIEVKYVWLKKEFNSLLQDWSRHESLGVELI